MRDEAVCCVLIVCLGLRDSMIGCILHVNARGSLEVYIWRRSARQADRVWWSSLRVYVWSA